MSRRDWERRRAIEDRIDRQLTRTGADWAYHDDVLTNLTVNLTRNVLVLVDAALDDEGVDPVVAMRVIDRVIYGVVPLPEDVAERKRQANRMMEMIKLPLVADAGWLRTERDERKAGT